MLRSALEKLMKLQMYFTYPTNEALCQKSQLYLVLTVIDYNDILFHNDCL